MKSTQQIFPAVTMEVMPSGLIRLEDDTDVNGTMAIDLHPAQVQVLASLIGFTVPDKTIKAIGRLLERLKGIEARSDKLRDLLDYALKDQDIEVAPELCMSEAITENLREVVKDLQDLLEPAAVPVEGREEPGGQLCIPM